MYTVYFNDESMCSHSDFQKSEARVLSDLTRFHGTSAYPILLQNPHRQWQHRYHERLPYMVPFTQHSYDPIFHKRLLILGNRPERHVLAQHYSNDFIY